MTNGEDMQMEASGGSLGKGVVLAALCQTAYLLGVTQLPGYETRIIGYMLFALIQFGYLFPLAVFYRRQQQGLTSNGIIITAAVSLVAAAGWFGYAATHGALPSIGN